MIMSRFFKSILESKIESCMLYCFLEINHTNIALRSDNFLQQYKPPTFDKYLGLTELTLTISREQKGTKKNRIFDYVKDRQTQEKSPFLLPLKNDIVKEYLCKNLGLV